MAENSLSLLRSVTFLEFFFLAFIFSKDGARDLDIINDRRSSCSS